ncbi:hypothetical protein VP01_788g3 [Puccinia sorghi]|uniref:Uncharacterized protein n=1 Tax=Puccinia sorghi TaxID=27349 RepID=A0A0L6UAX9_9BASI|nr:hypothetical protein VP01_788g3 [Puccinia sorghi]
MQEKLFMKFSVMSLSNSKIDRSQGRAANKTEMEGDGPTSNFKEEAGSQGNTFHPMYHKMITKLEEYQEEALKCEALVAPPSILSQIFCSLLARKRKTHAITSGEQFQQARGLTN